MTVHNLICIVFDKKTIKTIITYNQLQAIEHAHFVWRIFSDQRNLLIRVFKRLTTAFLGLACSWDISSSCSGVHTRTLLSTLNHPLHRQRGCHHVKAMKSDRDRCLFLLLAVYVKSTSYLASSGDSANTWYVLSSVTMFRAFSFSWLSTISLWSHKKDTRLRNSGSVWTSGPEIKRKFPLIQQEAEEHARAAYNTF